MSPPVYLDLEFIERGQRYDIGGEVVSLGAVCGEALFYAESIPGVSLARAHGNDFVQAHVVPHLGQPGTDQLDRQDLAGRFREWVLEYAGPEPEFWTYCGAWDWVLTCGLYGGFSDKPEGWPYFALDLAQLAQEWTGDSTWPERMVARRVKGPDHHALADAIWLRDAHRCLVDHVRTLAKLGSVRPPW